MDADGLVCIICSLYVKIWTPRYNSVHTTYHKGVERLSLTCPVSEWVCQLVYREMSSIKFLSTQPWNQRTRNIRNWEGTGQQGFESKQKVFGSMLAFTCSCENLLRDLKHWILSWYSRVVASRDAIHPGYCSYYVQHTFCRLYVPVPVYIIYYWPD